MTIHIRPHPRNRQTMAAWLTSRPGPRVRTLNGGFTFAVTDQAYLDMPPELLLGALVEGHEFVPATLPADTPGQVHEGPFATYTGPAYAVGGRDVNVMPPVNLASAGLPVSEGVDGESDDWDDYDDTNAFVPPLEDGGTGHVCPICGKQLKDEHGVKIHVGRVHGTEESN